MAPASDCRDHYHPARLVLGANQTKLLVYAIPVLLPAVFVALCLNVSVMRKLVIEPGWWYITLSIVGGSVCKNLIFGPRFGSVEENKDGLRQFSTMLANIVTAFGLIVILAFLDAIPPRLVSPTLELHLFPFTHCTIMRSSTRTFDPRGF